MVRQSLKRLYRAKVFLNPCYCKEEAQRRHAARRAKERYNLELTEEMMKQIVSQIKRGLSEFVEKQSYRISLHRVIVGELFPTVVYDKKRKVIVTFL